MEDHYVDSWSDLEYYGRKLDRRSERNASVYSSDAMLDPDYALIGPPMLSSNYTTSAYNSAQLSDASENLEEGCMEISDREIEKCQDLNTWEVIGDPQLPKAKGEVMGLYESYMLGWTRHLATRETAVYSRLPSCDREVEKHCGSLDLERRVLMNQTPHNKYRVCSADSNFLMENDQSEALEGHHEEERRVEVRIANDAKFEVMPITERKALNCNEVQVQEQHKYRAECANEKNSRVTEFSNFQKSVKEIQTISLKNLLTFDLGISTCVKHASSTRPFRKFAKTHFEDGSKRRFNFLDGLKLFKRKLQVQLPLNWVSSLFKTAKGERSGNCGGAKGNHRKKQREWELILG